MTLQKKVRAGNPDDYILRCGIPSRCQKSIQKSFTSAQFNTHRQSLRLWMILVLHYFPNGVNASIIFNKLVRNGYDIDYDTIRKIYQDIREIVSFYWQEKQENERLSGDIEVDESMFTHRRLLFYENDIQNIRLHQRQVWIFGLIDRDSKDAQVYVVPNRTAQTLSTILEDRVQGASMIHHDGARFYQAIDYRSLGLFHQRYVHEGNSRTQNMIIPSNRRGTTQVESLWNSLKKHIVRIYNQLPDTNIDDYLYEAMWRREIKRYKFKSN